jgi:hypothetical protein
MDLERSITRRPHQQAVMPHISERLVEWIVVADGVHLPRTKYNNFPPETSGKRHLPRPESG